MSRIEVLAIIRYIVASFMKVDQQAGGVTTRFAHTSPAPVDELRTVIWVPGEVSLSDVMVAKYETVRLMRLHACASQIGKVC